MQIAARRKSNQKKYHLRRKQLPRQRRTHLQLRSALDLLKKLPIPQKARPITARTIRRLSALVIRAFLTCAHRHNEESGPAHRALVGVGRHCIPVVEMPQRRCLDCGIEWDRRYDHLVLAA
jgi:hypothetical protein